jgi:hypothetical protein
LDPSNSDDILAVKKEPKVWRQTYRVEGVGVGKPAKSKKEPVIDGSNENCEICNKEGNLLCCDTCSLVFHLHCLRPKLDFIPDGPWSCPYCVLDVSLQKFSAIQLNKPLK